MNESNKPELVGVELVDKKQLAKLLCISTRSVDRKVLEGGFPKGIKFGSGSKAAVRWPKSVIEKWVAEQYAKANEESEG